jgi:hypothetical protein
MISDYVILWNFLIIQFQLVIKDWIRPTNLSLIAGTYSDLTLSRTVSWLLESSALIFESQTS